MSSDKKRNVVSLYVKDNELFERTIQDTSSMWYLEFGESLSKSELMLKAMFMLQQYLKGNLKEFETKKPITKKIGRISS